MIRLAALYCTRIVAVLVIVMDVGTKGYLNNASNSPEAVTVTNIAQ